MTLAVYIYIILLGRDPRTRARWRFFGRARCDGRALGLLLMARAATMRAENRRRWSGRGGGGAALAAVAGRITITLRTHARGRSPLLAHVRQLRTSEAERDR